MIPGERRRQQHEKGERARQTGPTHRQNSGEARREAQLTRGPAGTQVSRLSALDREPRDSISSGENRHDQQDASMDRDINTSLAALTAVDSQPL